jgi:hypothetical protein
VKAMTSQRQSAGGITSEASIPGQIIRALFASLFIFGHCVPSLDLFTRHQCLPARRTRRSQCQGALATIRYRDWLADSKLIRL